MKKYGKFYIALLPDRLPDQDNIIRLLLTQTPTQDQLSRHFSRKTQKRADQIQTIFETFKALKRM